MAHAKRDRLKLTNFRVPWYRSYIVRLVLLTVLIMLCGYGASLYTTIHGIESMSKMAFRSDVQANFGEQLDLLKKHHDLEKQLITQRMTQFFGAAQGDRWFLLPAEKQKKLVDQALLKADVGEFFDGQYRLELNSSAPPSQDVTWSDQTKLKVGRWEVIFGENQTYREFKRVESLRQSYQLVGVALENEILPAMIQSAALVLLITFIVFLVLFYLAARQLRESIHKIVRGFIHWSARDSGYRLGSLGGGEMGLIATQFNLMADEVEENRRRSVFMEKLTSWQTVARKLAHEIKNPLTPIQMMVSQLARRYPGDDPDFKKLVDNAQQVVTEEVNGLRRMVDSFSQFARLPVAKIKEVELVGVLERITSLEQAAFSESTIELRSQVEQLRVDCDEDLLRQVLLNLVKNAVEASGASEAKVRIQLRTQVNNYSIEVHDEGPGISDDLKAGIFEAYFTTKHSGPAPGMGLGLAICQKIILDHNGRIELDSQPGHTVFALILPYRIAEAE